MKRIMLFLVTNLAVMLVLGVVLNILFSVLGINKSSISGLLVFCAVFGFGGSFISLLMSKWMAKRSYGVQVIEQPRNETEHWLVSTVARQAREAGIKMPEVGIYDSPEMNAFATGARRDDSLVAVSSGLLYSMSRDEAEAVLAGGRMACRRGTFVTVSCVSGTSRRGDLLARQHQGLCENMEGAAAARVCREFGLPFLELRCVSNLVEERDLRKWRLREACDRCGEAAALLLQGLRHD